jgi:hypothetical protein
MRVDHLRFEAFRHRRVAAARREAIELERLRLEIRACQGRPRVGRGIGSGVGVGSRRSRIQGRFGRGRQWGRKGKRVVLRRLGCALMART